MLGIVFYNFMEGWLGEHWYLGDNVTQLLHTFIVFPKAYHGFDTSMVVLCVAQVIDGTIIDLCTKCEEALSDIVGIIIVQRRGAAILMISALHIGTRNCFRV